MHGVQGRHLLGVRRSKPVIRFYIQTIHVRFYGEFYANSRTRDHWDLREVYGGFYVKPGAREQRSTIDQLTQI